MVYNVVKTVQMLHGNKEECCMKFRTKLMSLLGLCLLLAALTTTALAADSGFKLTLDYDKNLCTVNVLDRNDGNAIVPDGGYLTNNGGRASAIFEIENIKDGYRIADVTLNDVSYKNSFIMGTYGGMATSVKEDLAVKVTLEKVPANLPVLKSFTVYTDAACTQPLTATSFDLEEEMTVYVKPTYVDGGRHENYTARGHMEYTLDGSKWQWNRWGSGYTHFPMDEGWMPGDLASGFDMKIIMEPDDLYCTGDDIVSVIYHVNGGAPKAEVTKPAITTQPKSVSATAGSTAKFTVAASGDDLSYQWQYRTSSSGTWAKATATGNQTATLSVPATASRNGYQYRCKITNSAGSVTSNAATLTVKEAAAAKPAVTTQPTAVTVAPTGKATFTVAASGTGLSYQWQYRTSSAGTWANATATGNKTATLTLNPANASRDGYQYRCKITNSAGTVTSNAVTLYIKPAITAQPKSITAETGSTAKFTVAATGKNVTYQWQYRTSSTGTWTKATATGNQTATLSVPATTGRNGYQYRCVVTGASGKITYSNAATLTVKAAVTKPTITTQPTAVTVAPTGKATFTVKASGTGLSYQWQYRVSSTGTWANATATGNKSATLTLNPANATRDGYQYRCKVTNSAGTVYSNAVTLYIKPAVTAQPKNVTAEPGSTAKFTVAATGKGLTYQWQYRTSASGSWLKTSATGNKTTTLSVAVTEAKSGYQYRCVITGASGKITYSNAATLTVQAQQEGHLLTFVYPEDLCTMYATIPNSDHSVRYPSGTRVPDNEWLLFQIADIEDGYRIKSVMLNGSDWSDVFINGAYGGMSTRVNKDFTFVVEVEKVPDVLPEVKTVTLYMNNSAGQIVLAPDTVYVDENTRFYGQATYADGKEYPEYYIGGVWEYSTDGVNWKQDWTWGKNRFDYWPGWTSRQEINPNESVDFFLNGSYDLRVKILPKNLYAAGEVYSNVIHINGGAK